MPSIRTRISVLALLACIAGFAPSAAQASTPAQPRGLFDLGGVIGGVVGGLTGLLSNLLGTAQLDSLTQVTSSLTGGAAPSAQTLAPLTSLAQGLATGSGVPTDLQSQASGVLALLSGGGTAPMPAADLNKVTSLLGTLALTQGLSGSQVAVLDNLVAAIQSSAGTIPGGLPIVGDVVGSGGLPVGGDLTGGLGDVLTQVTAGAAPTGELLKPVTDLLREVAASIGAPLDATLIGLADAIDQAGAIGDDLLGPLTTVLGQIAATPGISPATAAKLTPLATALSRAASGGATPSKTSTKVLYATTKISKLRVDRKRGTLVVSLACQSLAHKCAAVLTPLRGRSAAGRAIVVIVPSGGTATRKLKLSSAARRLMKRSKSFKVTVTAISQRGTKNSKSVTSRAPRHKHA